MSENRNLFVISRILISLLFFTLNSLAQNTTNNCASSSCGNIRISYPFRLSAAQRSCGYDDPTFELQCQNNQTILNVGSRGYIVQDINYDYYTIRLVDPNVNRANLSSCPAFRNYYDWPSILRSSLDGISVAFIYCLAPVKSSKYVEGPFCGSRSSIFSNSSQIHTYVMAGNRIMVSDIEEGCTVGRVVQVSGRRGVSDNSSLAGIYDDLAYGIELSWFLVSCGDCERDDGYCSVVGTRITCKYYCKESTPLHLQSFKCKPRFNLC